MNKEAEEDILGLILLLKHDIALRKHRTKICVMKSTYYSNVKSNCSPISDLQSVRRLRISDYNLWDRLLTSGTNIQQTVKAQFLRFELLITTL